MSCQKVILSNFRQTFFSYKARGDATYGLLAPTLILMGSQRPLPMGSWPLPPPRGSRCHPSPYWVALPSPKDVCQWAFWPHCVLLMLVHCLKFCFIINGKKLLRIGKKLILNPMFLFFYSPFGGGWMVQKQIWMNPPF